MEIAVELESSGCAQCGVVFAMPTILTGALKKTGQTFYCPNGHSLSFGKGENDRLRGQINDMSNMIQGRDEEIKSLGQANSNQKGQISKLKKKLSKGEK